MDEGIRLRLYELLHQHLYDTYFFSLITETYFFRTKLLKDIRKYLGNPKSDPEDAMPLRNALKMTTFLFSIILSKEETMSVKNKTTTGKSAPKATKVRLCSNAKSMGFHIDISRERKAKKIQKALMVVFGTVNQKKRKLCVCFLIYWNLICLAFGVFRNPKKNF